MADNDEPSGLHPPQNMRKVVAVNVSPIMAQDYKMNIVSIAMRSFHFMFRANTFPEREKCDLLIEP